MPDKLDQILGRLDEMDKRLMSMERKLDVVDEMDKRLVSMERKLDVVALSLLAPEECAVLGIPKKPTPARRGGGTPGGDGVAVPLAAKPR